MVKVTIELEKGVKKVIERECVLMTGGTPKGSNRIEVEKAIVGESTTFQMCLMLIDLMNSVIDQNDIPAYQRLNSTRLKQWAQKKEDEIEKHEEEWMKNLVNIDPEQIKPEQMKPQPWETFDTEGDNNGKE